MADLALLCRLPWSVAPIIQYAFTKNPFHRFSTIKEAFEVEFRVCIPRAWLLAAPISLGSTIRLPASDGS